MQKSIRSPQPQPRTPTSSLSRQLPPFIHHIRLFGRRPVDCKAVAPEAFQDIVVGSAIMGTVSVAVYCGVRKDPVPCSLCKGTGGTRCFACGGDGKSSSATASLESNELYEDGPSKRTSRLGRMASRGACKVCKGKGMLLCSQCKGSGFQSAPL
ncbi:hypothetical protein Agub_g1213 [Astrephomene gubernaculifera]|uniref:Uncharacterized protein n=1 Tax=Astrephomene gubernaculifera TaxID=47775 RepID=A0AAD3DF15_9CHLO|nr:hypothetical protein Agub_g1213 [Astrephomene gubernaculifera]